MQHIKMALLYYKTEIVLYALECSELHGHCSLLQKLTRMLFVLRSCRFGGVSASCEKLDFLTVNLVSSHAETTQFKIK